MNNFKFKVNLNMDLKRLVDFNSKISRIIKECHKKHTIMELKNHPKMILKRMIKNQ